MIIPGLTKQDIYDVMGKVAKNHRGKSFDCYSSEDIEQEVWLICLNKIARFEPEKTTSGDLKSALERWLNAIVSNSLKNFFRDNYTVPNKHHIKNGQTLFNHEIDITILEKKCHKNVDILENIDAHENWEYLITQLNEHELLALESLLNGEDITSYYRGKLLIKVKSILEEANGHN